MARKFTFNLQKYLDYKESIVNGKAADLLKSKKLLDKENNKLEKLFDEKTTEDDLRGLVGRLVDSSLLKLSNFDPQAPIPQLRLHTQLQDVSTAVERDFMTKNIFQQPGGHVGHVPHHV